MTDKAPKYPEDFGDGIDYEYHYGKKEIILICIIGGLGLIAVYYWFEIQHQLKTVDWTLDPNVDWTCHSLTAYEKAVETSTKTAGFPFPRQLEEQLSEKRTELNCK